MVKKYRDLTEKYKTFRLQPDALYQSRTVQTLFNKFTKRGKKTVVRQHILQALTQMRYTLRRPRTYNILMGVLRSLRLHLILVSKRQGKQMIDIPVPIRRNKRDIMNIQTLYNAVSKREEKSLNNRIEQELQMLTIYQAQSTTLKQRSAYMSRIYDERVNMEKR